MCLQVHVCHETCRRMIVASFAAWQALHRQGQQPPPAPLPQLRGLPAWPRLGLPTFNDKHIDTSPARTAGCIAYRMRVAHAPNRLTASANGEGKADPSEFACPGPWQLPHLLALAGRLRGHSLSSSLSTGFTVPPQQVDGAHCLPHARQHGPAHSVWVFLYQ